MSKYWKSIVLFTFTAVIIGVFYVKADTVSNGFAQLEFEKKEGNDAAVEKLVINGDLFYGMFSFEPFRVDKQGTTYLRDESFSKRLKGFYPDLYIEQLQKEYRNFMRGKDEDPDYYYEDENILAYGDTPYEFWTYDNYKFEIAVLDKKTNDTISFSLPIPNRGDYWYVEPYGVFVEGKELSIITVNEKMSNETIQSTTAHIYTFDLEKKQLINEEVIGSVDYSNDGEGYSEINLVKGEDYFIIAGLTVTPVEFDEESGNYNETGKLTNLIKYDIKSKHVEELPIPENEDIGIPFSLNGDQIYFASVEKNQLFLSIYNTETKKVTDKLEIDNINSYMSIYDIQQAEVEDGKLYFVPSTQNVGELPSIVVVDLNNLTLDYIGQIVNTKPPENNEIVEMYFNYPELKQ